MRKYCDVCSSPLWRWLEEVQRYSPESFHPLRNVSMTWTLMLMNVVKCWKQCQHLSSFSPLALRASCCSITLTSSWCTWLRIGQDEYVFCLLSTACPEAITYPPFICFLCSPPSYISQLPGIGWPMSYVISGGFKGIYGCDFCFKYQQGADSAVRRSCSVFHSKHGSLLNCRNGNGWTWKLSCHSKVL